MNPRILCLILLGAILVGCHYSAAPETAPEPALETSPVTVPETTVPPTEESTLPPDPIQVLLDGMTLREKVGQLFIVRPDALTGDGIPPIQMTDALDARLSEYPVGGVVLFADNIQSPEQLAAFLEGLQAASSTPLFLCVDEEGGTVARLAGNSAFGLPRYRSAAAVGASGNPEDALEMGRTIGGYLKKYGFNMDFAPVADVNTNPHNPVIGSRAFSSDPDIAAAMAGAMAEGLEQAGIIPVFKHFPGHGDTAQDSHSDLAVTRKTREALESCEWLPFLEADSGDLIMVGHIAVPEITGNNTPATLSYSVVTEILKGELGFEGLVITDALEMGGITQQYSSGEAAVAALLAGCDILLMPEDLPEAFDAVIASVEDGRLSMKWLDETVYRIIAFKSVQGILDPASEP